MSINTQFNLGLASVLYLLVTNACRSALSSLANIPQTIREIGANLYNRMPPQLPTVNQDTLQLATTAMSISLRGTYIPPPVEGSPLPTEEEELLLTLPILKAPESPTKTNVVDQAREDDPTVHVMDEEEDDQPNFHFERLEMEHLKLRQPRATFEFGNATLKPLTILEEINMEMELYRL